MADAARRQTVTKAALLRERLADTSHPVILIGTHNALVGRLLERAGVDGGWVSSFEMSATHGLPDINVIGMREMLDAARYINMATQLPLIVDAENGYGSIDNTVRAVQEMEATGIAGMCLDDTTFPKTNSFAAGDHRLRAPSAFADKLGRAKQAQETSDFIVMARTESLISGETMDRALFRANLYADAGADLVLVHSSRSDGSEAVEIARRWTSTVPLVSIPTAFLHMSQSVLARLGYRVIILANQLLRASVWNMERVLEDICRDGTAAGIQDRAVSMQHIFDLAGGNPPPRDAVPADEPGLAPLGQVDQAPLNRSDSLGPLRSDARARG